MSAICDLDKDYPSNTLGYHFKNASSLFGKSSASVKFLTEKANESEKQFDETVVVPEEQMVFLLLNMEAKDVKKSKGINLTEGVNKKVDMRFNDTREAIIEISRSLKQLKLKDEAIAILVAGSGSGITKTQVLVVLSRLKELENMYIKKD